MDVNSYQIFLTLAAEMNYHRAAQELYISQQALSAHIHRMEQELGAPLFDRRPTLRLTRAGEALKVYAEQILASESAMRSHFADISRRANSVLCLGINHQRFSAILGGVCRDFQREFPNVSLCLMDNYLASLQEDMKKGQVDVFVGQDYPECRDIRNIGLVTEPTFCVIHETLLKQYFPTDYDDRIRRYRQEGCSLEELIRIPVNLTFRGSSSRKPIDAYFHKRKLTPHIQLECIESSFLFDLATYGNSYSVISAIGIYHYVKYRERDPGLHIFRVRDVPHHKLSICYREDILQPQYVLRMVEIVREEFRKYAEFMNASGIPLESPDR